MVLGRAERRTELLTTQNRAWPPAKGAKPLLHRPKGRKGGGVALLVRDGLTYRERPDLGTFTEGEFESFFVEIVRGGGAGMR